MIVLVLIIIGVCLGSFINALVWRLHEQEKLATSKKAKSSKLSIMRGRSMCPNCHHQLEAKDLIPVISWISLDGKCRYCHKPISWQYPLVELFTAGLFVFSWAFWPLQFSGIGLFEFIVWSILLVGLVALAVYDLKWFLLPNRIVYPLIILVLIQLLVIVVFGQQGLSPVYSAFWGALIGGGIFYVLFHMSQGKWIGGGDVKLGLMLGIVIGGPLNSILMLFIASCSGTLLALPFVIAGKAKRNSHLPFGPLLIVGAIIVRLFGLSINHWLNNLR